MLISGTGGKIKEKIFDEIMGKLPVIPQRIRKAYLGLADDVIMGNVNEGVVNNLVDGTWYKKRKTLDELKWNFGQNITGYSGPRGE